MLVVARARKFAILRLRVIESRALQNLFSPATAERKSAMLAKCEAALHGHEPMRRYHVPGRIEVLGKHTDYAGGRSMVAATEQGFIMTAAPRGDRVVQVTNADARATISFEIHPELQPSQGSWANYPMTVARRVARNFPGELRGVEIALSSDLPPAAGLSSSSALITAVFLALADANNLWEREEFRRNIHSIEDLAGYLGTNENGQTFADLVGDRGVGTFGGSQDHTAILGSQAGRLKVYKYCPVKLEQTIDLPRGWIFAVASSGLAAEKTGGAMEKYNRVSQRVAEILKIWRDNTGRADATLDDALRSSRDAAVPLRITLY
jgi:galactokinase